MFRVVWAAGRIIEGDGGVTRSGLTFAGLRPVSAGRGSGSVSGDGDLSMSEEGGDSEPEEVSWSEGGGDCVLFRYIN